MNAAVRVEAPINLDLEQSLLGSLILAAKAYPAVAEFLAPEHFAEELHATIFRLIGEAFAADGTFSLVTVKNRLPPGPLVGDFTAAGYLAHITAGALTVSPSAIMSLARSVHEWAIRRNLLAVADDMTAMATDPAFGMPVRDQIADAEKRLIQLSEDAARSSPETSRPRQDYAAVLGDVEDRRRTGRYLRGVSTGLVALDERIGGFGPGTLILLAARPSVGKTMVATSIARRCAHAGAGVAFDSIEMPEDQIRLRLLSDEACAEGVAIAYSRAGKGRVRPEDVSALHRAADRLRAAPLAIIDQTNRLADIPGHIRQARQELSRFGVPLSVFFIDYLGLLSPGDRYKGQRTQEVGEISLTLKAMAKREGLCIVALHQLNRANESRGDKRPILSDLRDSGSLEQDADVVIFVHREAYYLQRAGYADMPEPERLAKLLDCEHKLELIVAKQRQGPIGVDYLWCDTALNAVRDLAQ